MYVVGDWFEGNVDNRVPWWSRNGIQMFLHFYHYQQKLKNIQQQYLPMIIVYFHPNVDSVFLYRSLRRIFLHNTFKLYIVFWCIIAEAIISSLPTFHWTKNTDMSKMKWKCFYCGNIKSLWKKSITSSWRTKHFFAIILPFFSLSCVISHNSHILFFLNGLNLFIKHLDVFWNIWNLILWRDSGKKRSSCYDYSKNGSFIIGKSEQQFKTQSRF